MVEAAIQAAPTSTLGDRLDHLGGGRRTGFFIDAVNAPIPALAIAFGDAELDGF